MRRSVDCALLRALLLHGEGHADGGHGHHNGHDDDGLGHPGAGGEKVALKTFLYQHLCAPFASPETAPFFGFLASPQNASLMWACFYVVGLYLVAYEMYRRKWFLKF